MIAAWLAILLAAAQSPAGAHRNAARAAEAAGDFRTAEREYAEALKDHADWELYQRLGLVRHLQNNYSGAIDALEQAIRLNPQAWGARLFLGIDYYRTNRFDRALDALLAARRAQPSNPEVQFWLGATYIALRRRLEGLEILEALSQKQPRNLEALRLLAQTYSDLAVELHNRLAEEQPDSAWAHRVHGQALEADGACQAALAEYRKARALKPDMDGIAEAIARCEKRP